MVKVAVMGYGTIGSGVAEVLDQNRELIAKQAGREIELKYVLDLREFPKSPVKDKIIHDFHTIERDPDISIVVETMGGLNPAYPFVKACLEAGKHVVTSNKALVAAHGTELLAIARENRVNFLFEASVGGGIPIIRPLYRCLAGEQIEEITGILNGTTNFILTKMEREGASFEDVLKEAQELGYAERNPEADVEGHDTCRKIAILTAMVTGKEVDYEAIATEGITKITDVDFQYAGRMRTGIKLFGSSRIKDGQAHAFVAPVMVGRDHPLYAVSDVYNGILVRGNMVGTTMFYGSGAGKLPTASAVVADIIECAQNPEQNILPGWSDEKLTVCKHDDLECRYFVRISGNAAQMEDEIGRIFGTVQTVELEGMEEFAVLTDTVTEAGFKEMCKKLGDGQILQVIRAEI